MHNMELLKLEKLDSSEFDKRVLDCYLKYLKLLEELGKKSISEDVILQINDEIRDINAFESYGKPFQKQLRQSQERILRVVERDLKLVPKYSYRKRWLVIGFSLFGISFGVTFGVIVGNMAFLGVGIPFGILIGGVIGEILDRRAFNEGRQLDVDF